MSTEPRGHLPSAVLFYPSGSPAPADAAEAFGPVAETLRAALADLPNGEQRVVNVNGIALHVGFWDTVMENRALLGDLAVSPLRAHVEPSIVDGRAFASVAALDGDPRAALSLIAQIAGAILEDSSADASWLPEQGLVTTQVMFMHDLYEDQIERTWFRVHAMRASQGSTEAVAFTRGLRVLGDFEVQIRVTAEPADLFAQLTEGVATLLRDGAVPEPGTEVRVGSTTYRATPGQDIVDEDVSVLELAPAPGKKKGWFGRG